MPGYAIQPAENKPVLIVEPDTLEEIYGNVFYGMRYNPADGSVTVDVIREGEVVKLPESNEFKEYDYAHWFSSPKSINFTWEDSNKKTRLLMEII